MQRPHGQEVTTCLTGKYAQALVKTQKKLRRKVITDQLFATLFTLGVIGASDALSSGDAQIGYCSKTQSLCSGQDGPGATLAVTAYAYKQTMQAYTLSSLMCGKHTS